MFLRSLVLVCLAQRSCAHQSIDNIIAATMQHFLCKYLLIKISTRKKWAFVVAILEEVYISIMIRYIYICLFLVYNIINIYHTLTYRNTHTIH